MVVALKVFTAKVTQELGFVVSEILVGLVELM
jgi:hypothetical protein